MDHRDRYQAHPLPSAKAETLVFVLCLFAGLFALAVAIS